MQMTTTNDVLTISKNLTDILIREIANAADSECQDQSSICLNFRSPGYSATRGGYHPVEISIESQSTILYITEFSYAGCGDMAELVKEVDFDFSSGVFQHFDRIYAIECGLELFQVWQQNFCHYYHTGIYEVTVTQ